MTNKEIQTTKYIALTAAISAAAMSQAINWVDAFERKCSETYSWGVVEIYAELAEIAYVSAEMLCEISATGVEVSAVYAYDVDEPTGKGIQKLLMSGDYEHEDALLLLGSYAAEFYVCTENQETLLPIIEKHTGYVP